MLINLIQKSLKNISGPTLVTFSHQTKDKKVKLFHPELFKRLEQAVQDKLLSGKTSEIQIYRELEFEGFRHVVVVGLGPDKDVNHEVVRQVAAGLYDAVKALQVTEAVIDFDSIPSRRNGPPFLKALVEGLSLSAYEF